MPVPALVGISFVPVFAAEMIGEFVKHVSVLAIPCCSHWIPKTTAVLLEHVSIHLACDHT
jgi:hypothetical protein